MPTVKLDQRRVDALKPRKSAYDVRDRDLKGFGLRVWPSGKKRYFVHSQHRGRRVWKTIASAESTSAGEARAWAATMLAAIRRGGDAPASPEEAVFEAVADEVFTRYARNWKPGTLKVNRNYYRNHILPRFKGHPIAGIDSRGRAAVVRLAPRKARGGGPVRSDPVRHHAPSRNLRLSPGRQQPVQGHQAIPARGARTVPVGSGDTQLGGGTRPLRGRPSATGRHHQAAAADRVSCERGSHAEVALPARRQAVPAGQQDRAANGLVVFRRPRGPGPRAANGKLDVPLAEDERPPQP